VKPVRLKQKQPKSMLLEVLEPFVERYQLDFVGNGEGSEIGIHPNLGGRLLSLGELQPKAASCGVFVLSGDGGISMQGVEELDGFRITQWSYSASSHHDRLGNQT
jgi:hypothetical protein